MNSIDSDEVFLTARDRDDAEILLGVPTVGFIPAIDEPERRLIRNIDTFSPLMEYFRSLRTNVGFLAEPPLRSLAVVSSVPAEGKSTVVANLAMAFALKVENNRVILVDTDLRRPSQHKLFAMDSSPGLTDVLAGTHTVEQALRATMVPNVMVLPFGSPPPNPAELLESEAMGRLLEELKTLCDIVLLDTPPALAVVDALVVAPRADGVLVVIGSGETKKVHALKTMQLLSRARAHVIGTVFNRVIGPTAHYYGMIYVPFEPSPKEGAG